MGRTSIVQFSHRFPEASEGKTVCLVTGPDEMRRRGNKVCRHEDLGFMKISEEDQESLCDTVLCCILLSMRCVRLRCVWFCVFLLDLGSQALVYACVSLVFLLTGESSALALT